MKMVDEGILLGIRQIRLPGLAVEGIPAEPKRSTNPIGFIGADRTIAREKRGIRVEELDRLHGIEGLGIASAAFAASRKRE